MKIYYICPICKHELDVNTVDITSLRFTAYCRHCGYAVAVEVPKEDDAE